MHDGMPFAVHFDDVALKLPASVAVGEIMPLAQQKMYGLDIEPIVMQQKMNDHEIMQLMQQKMCDHDNVCSVSS